MITLKHATILALVATLGACSNPRDKEHVPFGFKDQTVHNNWGPITTHPIVGRNKVPAGTTPTGDTGYAVANTARSNGSIVQGTAAPCGQANTTAYSDGCSHAAGYGLATDPYH